MVLRHLYYQNDYKSLALRCRSCSRASISTTFRVLLLPMAPSHEDQRGGRITEDDMLRVLQVV